MSGPKRGLAASLAFFALTVPFGIAAHLVSELAGLGWQNDARLVLSARHGYLALFAAVSLLCLIAALHSLPGGERRAKVALLVEALPCKGSGAGFFTLAFLAQFGFFALTQFGEGSPLCGGDLATGVLAAALAAVAGAAAITLCKRRFLEFAIGLVCEFLSVPGASRVPSGVAAYRGPSAAAPRRSPFSFRYRPPPLAA